MFRANIVYFLPICPSVTWMGSHTRLLPLVEMGTLTGVRNKSLKQHILPFIEKWMKSGKPGEWLKAVIGQGWAYFGGVRNVIG